MKLAIRRYQQDDLPAIGRLNERLTAGGAKYPFYPEDPAGAGESLPFRSRVFVAANGSEIRGGVWLSEQRFRLDGADVDAGWARYPVAESLVDPSYGGVPGSLMFFLLRQQPRLMALGLGGHQGPFARLLAGMGFKGSIVPFYVRVVRPYRVLRDLSYVRRRPAMRLLLDAMAYTGVGWVGAQAAIMARAAAAPRVNAGLTADVVTGFESWADDLWMRSRDAYGFIASRDSATLNTRYPAHKSLVTRLRIRRAGRDIGWACVVAPDPKRALPDPYFGRLNFAILADSLALPADAADVTVAATRWLSGAGFDIAISSHTHPAWQQGLHAAGFFDGPSNFAFYRSPAMEKLLAPVMARPDGLFLNRGDCDGPWLG